MNPDLVTAERAAELLDGATPGPWADSTFEDGAICGSDTPEAWRSSRFPFAGIGGPVVLRRTNGGGLPRKGDAALILAAPALAATVVALSADLAELRATLAAERGDPAGALPGWAWDTNTWHRPYGPVGRVGVKKLNAEWDVILWGSNLPPGFRQYSTAPTAREAMRLADASLPAPFPPR